MVTIQSYMGIQSCTIPPFEPIDPAEAMGVIQKFFSLRKSSELPEAVANAWVIFKPELDMMHKNEGIINLENHLKYFNMSDTSVGITSVNTKGLNPGIYLTKDMVLSNSGVLMSIPFFDDLGTYVMGIDFNTKKIDVYSRNNFMGTYPLDLSFKEGLKLENIFSEKIYKKD